MQSTRLKFKDALKFQNKGNYKKARELYEDILLLDDKFLPAINNLGVSFLALKMYENALNCFEKVAALNPKDADAYFNIGKVLSLLGNHAGAVKAYKNAERFRPKDLSIVKNIGIEYISIGEFSKAIVNFEHLIKNSKQDWESYYFLGLSLFKIKNINGSLASLEKARSLNSTKSKIPLLIGDILSESDDIEKAENAYMNALALSPNSSEILEKVVRFLYKNNFSKKASNIIDSFLLDHPYDFVANRLLEEIKSSKYKAEVKFEKKNEIEKSDIDKIYKDFISKKDWTGGLAYFSRLNESKTKNISLSIKTAFFLLKCNEYEKVLKTFEGIEEKAIGKEGLLIISKALIALKRRTDAKKILERLLSEDSLDETIYYLLGKIKFEEGRISESIVNLERALTILPEMREANALLGKVYFFKGDISKSHSLFSRMLRIYPDNSDALYFLGFIYFRQKDFFKSERMFKRYLTFVNDDFDAMDFLARIYLRINRVEKAMDTWKDITEISPKNTEEKILRAKAFLFLEEFELCYKELCFAEQSITESPGIKFYKGLYFLVNNEIKKTVIEFVESWRLDRQVFKDESIFILKYFNLEKLKIIVSALFDSNFSEAHEIANFFESRLEDRK